MADLIRLELGEDQRKIRKILHYTGLPCDARSITDAVLQMEAPIATEPLLLVRAEAQLTATGDDRHRSRPAATRNGRWRTDHG